MKKNTILIILSASIAFNLAFIGVFLSFRFFGHPKPAFDRPPFPQNQIAKELFMETRVEMRKQSEAIREKKMLFFKELSSSDYKEEELKDIVDDIIINQIEMEKYLAKRLIAARKRMSDDEASDFFQNFEQHERGQMQRFNRKGIKAEGFPHRRRED